MGGIGQIQGETMKAMLLIFFAVVLGGAAGVRAATPSSLVRQANDAFAGGDYERALDLYEEASVDLPESPQIQFNRGAALYRKGDFAAAAGEFEEAAIGARQPKLAAQAKYNLGNTRFRMAQRQEDSDLSKAIDACRRSIESYQEALELDPSLLQAAENVEIVRLYLKNLLDHQKREQEQSDLGERLKELIERQQAAIESNLELARSEPAEGESEAWNTSKRQLESEQDTLREDTDEIRREVQALREQVLEPGGNRSPSAEDQDLAARLAKAGDHLGTAAGEQGQSLPPLRETRWPQARSHQERALEELVAALRELSDSRQQEQQQQQQQQQEQGHQQEPQKRQPDQPEEESQGEEGQSSPQRSDDSSKDPGDEGGEEQEASRDRDGQENDGSSGEDSQPSRDDASPEPETEEEAAEEFRSEAARDILEEEQENLERRRLRRLGRGGRPVEKDW